MASSATTWAIVLAGGEGSRLHSLTTTDMGIAIPKQFCSLHGDHSLLREALHRAQAVAAHANICVVVARQHRSWWEAELAAEPSSNVVIQPDNRGTANGILLPLLHIMRRDPNAQIVLLPSDHHVLHEHVLAAALQKAARELDKKPDHVFLLGIPPEQADPDLGYIVPECDDGPAISTVSRFVEKPNAPLAQVLIEAGALWNTLIVAARALTLFQLFQRRFPQIAADMQSIVERDQCIDHVPDTVINLYQRLPDIDFSRQILQKAESALRVVHVRQCGWSDLGTPKRVAEALRRRPRSVDASHAHGSHRPLGLLSLATQHARQLKNGCR